MTCRCESPMLARDGVLVRCQMCGSPPREDLGGTDDLARLRYRVKLNGLREGADAKPVLLTRSQVNRQQMLIRRKRVRELKAEKWSNGSIARELGVSTTTVRCDLDPNYAKHQRESAQRSRCRPENKQRKAAYMDLWRENYRDLNMQIIREFKLREKAA